MNLIEYQEAAIKTIKYRGTTALDCEHMIIGMFSEINELMDAKDTNDPINILEEIGDFSWYLFNYATLRKIPVQIQTDVAGYSLVSLVKHSSRLSDIVKKLAIYNKEINVEEERIEVQKLVEILSNYQYVTIDNKVEKIDIFLAFDRNIDKLHKKRYKNAVYSDEAAQNRNLDEERKALEGNA